MLAISTCARTYHLSDGGNILNDYCILVKFSLKFFKFPRTQATEENVIPCETEFKVALSAHSKCRTQHATPSSNAGVYYPTFISSSSASSSSAMLSVTQRC